MIDTRTSWNEASVAGLALGGFTVLCMMLSALVGKIEGTAILTGILNFIIWALKFAGCIVIMRLFMRKLTEKYPDADNRDTRSLGVKMALLSALIVAAYSMAVTSFINPDELNEVMQSALASMPMKPDSNTLAAMDRVMDKLPVIYFFSTLIYCWLYGTVLSSILSSNIPSRNPFERTDGQQDA